MEYCGDWFLLERDDAQLQELAVQAGVAPENVRFVSDATGLTHLVELVK